MTRTAATLLVGVAVTAVSGCMAAEPEGAPATGRHSSPAPQSSPRSAPEADARPSAPRSPGAALPRPAGQGGQPEILVEAPVHEVLEAAMLPSERAPEPRRAAAKERGGQGEEGAREKEERGGEARRGAPAQQHRAQPPARRTEPEPAEHRHRPAHRRTEPPQTPPRIPVSAADVCALGTGYGGWRPNSPEARICRETYGR
ncbi:hypothetical protein ACFYVL_42365 [Streptomyces sp. NPDC004111]|uniref:hypothetical protein n=1 Tax=Streptomyces sp. NPDC004111 TaxID=3364690 RepID=UPI003691711C